MPSLRLALHELDSLAVRLPFDVDDYEAASDLYARWVHGGSERNRRDLLLWIYIYTRRYFLIKFLREEDVLPSDLDDLTATAFQKAQGNLEAVRQPVQFANWVSVICRRTFLNFILRKFREQLWEEGEGTGPTPPAVPLPSVIEALDRPVVRQAVLKAIERLSPALQEVARMRLADGCSYEDISEATGHPRPTVRSYVSKAVACMREDAKLMALLDDFRE